MKRKIALGLLSLLLLFVWMNGAQGAVAWCSRGEDVAQIQRRLKQYGYLTAESPLSALAQFNQLICQHGKHLGCYFDKYIIE